MNDPVIRKAALVLAGLDPLEREAVLDQMPVNQATDIRFILDELPCDHLDSEDRATQWASIRDVVDSQNNKNLGAKQEEKQLIVVRSDSLRDLLSHEDETLARILAHERGSIVAAVLTSLPQSRAAGILRHLPSDLRHRTIAIWDAGMNANAKIVDLIAEWICDHLAESENEPSLNEQHHHALQAILDEFHPDEREQLLQDLAQENPLLARRLARQKNSAESSVSAKVHHEWSC